MKPTRENSTIQFEAINNFVQIELLEAASKGFVVTRDDKRLRCIARVLSVGPGRQLFNGTWVKLDLKPGDIITFQDHLLTEIYLNKQGTKRAFFVNGEEIFAKLKSDLKDLDNL